MFFQVDHTVALTSCLMTCGALPAGTRAAVRVSGGGEGHVLLHAAARQALRPGPLLLAWHWCADMHACAVGVCMGPVPLWAVQPVPVGMRTHFFVVMVVPSPTATSGGLPLSLALIEA